MRPQRCVFATIVRWIIRIVRKKRGFRVLVLNCQDEKLLDDTGVFLYCDHQFDRQFVLSLS